MLPSQDEKFTLSTKLYTTAHCSKLQFDFESKTRHMPATRNDFISKHFNVASSLCSAPILPSVADTACILSVASNWPQSTVPQRSSKWSQQPNTVYHSKKRRCIAMNAEFVPKFHMKFFLSTLKNPKNAQNRNFSTFFMPLRSLLHCPSGKAELEAAPTWAASVQDTPGLPIAA